jgi:hypothetical protein
VKVSSKRRKLAAALILISIVVAYVIARWPIDFNAGVWKSDTGGFWSARARMIGDLRANYLREGMSLADVNSLLGNPTSKFPIANSSGYGDRFTKIKVGDTISIWPCRRGVFGMGFVFLYVAATPEERVREIAVYKPYP